MSAPAKLPLAERIEGLQDAVGQARPLWSRLETLMECSQLTPQERDQLDAARLLLSIVTVAAEQRLRRLHRLAAVEKVLKSRERGSNIHKPE